MATGRAMATGWLISDRYRLIEQLPEHRPRVRWRARDEWSGQLVTAARVPIPGLAGSPALAARSRLTREAQAMQSCWHRHTAWLIDTTIDADDLLWVISEPAQAPTLAETLTEHGPVGPAQAARWGRDIADALATAHSVGVPHRDLHSGVVGLTENGAAVVGGFATTVVTRQGVRAGIPVHVAPETAFGTDEPSPACDVFALAAMLYNAVEGHSPFPETSDRATLLEVVAAGVVIVPRRTGHLTGLLLEMLHPDPAQRPTAAVVRDLLTESIGIRERSRLPRRIVRTPTVHYPHSAGLCA